MYKLVMVNNDNEILEFEKNRLVSFGYKKNINSVCESPYYKAIQSGDMLAFNCIKKDIIVGGMLITLDEDNLFLDKLFVKPEEREKGAGTFMLQYLENHKEYFEDYYGLRINRISLEPLTTTIDFYYNNGYDICGFQMYKKY